VKQTRTVNVWSAAFNPAGGAIQLPDGACVPDLPGSTGCELFDETKDDSNIIDPDGALCSNVCSFYSNYSVNSGQTQVGYSCDATLCTMLGIEQGNNLSPSASDQINLLNKGCNGIQDMPGMGPILLVETLAECSCCASQVCGCEKINATTDQQIYVLNQQQRDAGIVPQCDINNTLCGENE
jgi:hypothetical protein